MADDESKADVSAEKAYAEAAQAVPVTSAPDAQASKETVEAPAETKPSAPAKTVAAAKPATAAKPTPAKRAAAKTSAKAARPASKAKPAGKARATSKKVKPAKVPVKAAKPAERPAAKIQIQTAPKSSPISSLKEKTMQKNAKIAAGIQEVVADAQAKAKKVVEKGGSLLGEAGEFTKGNVEAVLESGKILAGGLQAMGKDWVADGRATVDMVTREVKDLASVKSPSEFIKVQSDIARKNVDAAIAIGSKNSEAMLKLVSDVMAPISGRFSLAAEKVRKAAA